MSTDSGITIDHEGATYRLTIDGEVKNAEPVIRTITDFIKASEYCHGLSQGQDKGRAESSGKGLPEGVAGAGEDAC